MEDVYTDRLILSIPGGPCFFAPIGAGRVIARIAAGAAMGEVQMEVQANGGIFVMFTVNKPGAERATGEDFFFGDEKETGAMIDEAFDGHESGLPQRAQMPIIEGGFWWKWVHELMQAVARVKAGGQFGGLGRGSDPA